MRNTNAIFIKQLRSFFKKPAIIGQVAMLLVMAAVFSILVQDVPSYAFTTIFSIMFVGLAMVGTTSSFIIEDRATMNLRFMAMAGVRPHQYLIGTGGALLLVSFGTLAIFSLIGRYSGMYILIFLGITMIGATASILLGTTLSLTKFPWLSGPFSMILGFAPMISDTNESVERIFRFLYTQQINTAIRNLSGDHTQAIQIILVNMAVILAVFIWMHKKNGLNG